MIYFNIKIVNLSPKFNNKYYWFDYTPTTDEWCKMLRWRMQWQNIDGGNHILHKDLFQKNFLDREFLNNFKIIFKL